MFTPSAGIEAGYRITVLAPQSMTSRQEKFRFPLEEQEHSGALPRAYPVVLLAASLNSFMVSLSISSK
jgi:hypothetical protein